MGVRAELEGEMRTAAMDGRLELLEQLLDEGADVNSINRHEMTALHLATYNNQEETVRFLLTRGADVTRQNRNGQTPLQVACVQGFLPLVKIYTKAGIDIHTKTGYSTLTALHLASNAGHPEVCQHLLDCGGDEDIVDVVGHIAEYYAANYPTELVFKKWKQVPRDKKLKLREDYAARKRNIQPIAAQPKPIIPRPKSGRGLNAAPANQNASGDNKGRGLPSTSANQTADEDYAASEAFDSDSDANVSGGDENKSFDASGPRTNHEWDDSDDDDPNKEVCENDPIEREVSDIVHGTQKDSSFDAKAADDKGTNYDSSKGNENDKCNDTNNRLGETNEAGKDSNGNDIDTPGGRSGKGGNGDDNMKLNLGGDDDSGSNWDSDEDFMDKYGDKSDNEGDGSLPTLTSPLHHSTPYDGNSPDGSKGRKRGESDHHDNDRGNHGNRHHGYKPGGGKKIPQYGLDYKDKWQKPKYGYKKGGGNFHRLKDHEFEWSDRFRQRQNVPIWERLGAGVKAAGAFTGGAQTDRQTQEGAKKEREPRSQSLERGRKNEDRDTKAGSQDTRSRYARAKSLERGQAAAQQQEDDKKRWGQKRGEAHWDKIKDHTFYWSEEYKKRQALSVFDRLKGGSKKVKEPAPSSSESTDAAAKKPEKQEVNLKAGAIPAFMRPGMNAKARVDTWRKPAAKKVTNETTDDKPAVKKGDQ